MFTNQHAIEKAHKLISLARSGTAGERQVAMTKLNVLLQTNGLTIDDLSPAIEPELHNAFYYMFKTISSHFKGEH